MRKSPVFSLSALIGLAACLWSVAVLAVTQKPAPSTTPAAAPQLVDFERQVHPILDASCSECHSQDKRKGGLSLSNYDDVLEGGKDGAVVRPGNSAGSMIIAAIAAPDRLNSR